MQFLKENPIAVWVVILSMILPAIGHTQNLNFERYLEVPIQGDHHNMNIRLYKQRGTQNWFYLPPAQSIRLGMKQDGQTPEFLFMKFTSESREDQGGIQGALLHFLVEWGLSAAEMERLEEGLKDKTNGNGKVKGPVDLQSPEGESFRIVSATLQDKELTRTFITSGMAPPIEGGKAAVAARLNGQGAQLLDATFQRARSITDLSLVLDYEYQLMVKAAKGKLTYNLEITQEQGDGIAYDLIKLELDNQPEKLQVALDYYEQNKAKMTDECGVGDGLTNVLLGMQAIDAAAGNTSGSGNTGSAWEYGISENMMRKVYDHFESNEMVTLEWEENLIDERVDVMREAFFNYFLNMFTEPADMPEFSSLSTLANDVTIDDEGIKEGAQGGYKFKSCTQLIGSRVLNKTIRLDKIILPVKRKYQMVANLASTYDQVKNNPKCVTSVNLNDPFFQHRDINFIVDLEAQEIFQQEINYVTVNVQKRRSNGRDFQDAVTIGNDYLQENGTLATITYARGNDTNSDKYKYKTQWSLKGGHLYPENPRYESGDWQGVTLVPPVKPRTVEFEADLDELTEMGIVRATAQIRYYKYGEEREENIPITVSKGVPLTEKTIFTDRNNRGYVYRLILTHKEKGKMVLDWQEKINDDYVYAIIPNELKENDPEFLNKVLEAGKELLRPDPDGSVKPGEKILEKFINIIDMFIEE